MGRTFLSLVWTAMLLYVVFVCVIVFHS